MAVGQVREVVDVSLHMYSISTDSASSKGHHFAVCCTVCIISKFMLQYTILIMFYIDMFMCCMRMYMCVCPTAGLY